MLKQTILLSFLFGVAFCVISPEMANSQQQFVTVLMKSQRSMADDPTRSTNCFALYLPQINALTAEYERSYNNCITRYDESIFKVEALMSGARSQMIQITDRMCSEYKNCQKAGSNMKFFECYEVIASNATTSSYDIQKDCQANQIFLEKEYLNIMYERDSCTDTASRIYVEESSRTYAELEKCLSA